MQCGFKSKPKPNLKSAIYNPNHITSNNSMKIRILLNIIVTLFAIPSAFSQNINEFKLKGFIVDSASKRPIEFAIIGLKKPAGQNIQTVFSKNEGSFLIENIAAGKAILTISMFSYKPSSIDIDFAGKTAADVGELLLVERTCEG